jgi:hypothetical protein
MEEWEWKWFDLSRALLLLILLSVLVGMTLGPAGREVMAKVAGLALFSIFGIGIGTEFKKWRLRRQRARQRNKPPTFTPWDELLHEDNLRKPPPNKLG